MASINVSRFSWAGLAFIVAAAWGCSVVGTNDDITLRTGTDTYAVGDEVRLRLENQSGSEVGYNLCFAYLDLQRRTGDEWHDVTADLGPDDSVACTAELRTLAPGDEAAGLAHIPADLPGDSYRITHDVEVHGEMQTIPSNSFVVAP
ncbi:MAG: hypothetical protein WD423_09660 [Rhodothermales bacterium]